MNLPNKITVGRMVMAFLILVILVFPFYEIGINMPKYLIAGKVILELKYIIVGILFAFASLSDFVDGSIARRQNIVTDFGKVMDAIADKILVNGVLIILAYDGLISVIVPVVIITRDIAVDSIKMIASSNGNAIGASIWGKLKTIFMMVGIFLVFFANLPFELLNFSLGNYLILIATVLSIYSGIQYFIANKKYISQK